MVQVNSRHYAVHGDIVVSYVCKCSLVSVMRSSIESNGATKLPDASCLTGVLALDSKEIATTMIESAIDFFKSRTTPVQLVR